MAETLCPTCGIAVQIVDVNLFELMGIPACFEVDRDKIEANFLALQRKLHPDNFSAKGVQAQMTAMQQSARLNDAYELLKDDVKRAVYLLELQGEKDVLSSTETPKELMVEQFAWREELMENGATKSLKENVKNSYEKTYFNISENLKCGDLQEVRRHVVALRFIGKFQKELKR